MYHGNFTELLHVPDKSSCQAYSNGCQLSYNGRIEKTYMFKTGPYLRNPCDYSNISQTGNDDKDSIEPPWNRVIN